MKEIKAIIQPFMAERVIAALRAMESLPGLTISDVRGFGRQRARAKERSLDVPAVFGVDKIKLEMVVPDHLVTDVIETIQKHAHTGNPGDGKIFVIPVEDAVRIRTGDHEPGVRGRE